MKMTSGVTRIAAIIILIGCIGTGYAQERPSVPPDGEFWFNGDRKESIWFADDQIFVLNPQNEPIASFNTTVSGLIPESELIEESEIGVRLILTDGKTATELLAASDVITRDTDIRYAAVYLPDPSQTENALVQIGEMVVFPSEGTSLEALDNLVLRQDNVERLEILMNGTAVLYSCRSDRICLEIANNLANNAAVRYAYPNWLMTRTTRFTSNDPLFVDQWHLTNTGQNGGTVGEDVNIQGAWDLEYDGSLVYIAIVDDGLELTHEDLAGNVDAANTHLDLVGGDSDPTPGLGDNHGTSVGGIAGAQGVNALGVSGAAPDPTLNGIRLLGANTDSNEATALNHNLLNAFDWNDIYNNSWGPPDNGALHVPGPLTLAALENGVLLGRPPAFNAGAIYVWAGGNGLLSEDNSNYDGYANSRYTISVAASNNDGVQSAYSEPGANLLVNAPSSDGGVGTTTTDLTGAPGYSSTNYTNSFGGTSSAAPLVAGIIALMFDANNQLGWRDVQRILAITAEQNDPSDADWVTNGVGLTVNHKYGFGRIDATAAVTLADTWSNLPAELSALVSLSPGTPIPNDGTLLSITIPFSDDIIVENVYLTLDSDHTYWGDLDVTLVSPDGTRSELAQNHGSGGAQLSGGFRFSTVRPMGESSEGDWVLEVSEGVFFPDTGSVVSVELEVFGAATRDCLVYESTVNLALGQSPTSGPDVIVGTPGPDVINGMGGDDIICGFEGQDEINGGRGEDLIFAGQGNDIVLGGNDRDEIYGGSGDDDLFGGPGDDLIIGESGNDTIFGNSGDDTIEGGEGVDNIRGSSGNDEIRTGSGATVGTAFLVDAGSGNDIIYGGPDADVIRGSTDMDTIYGHEGDDQLFGGGGEDMIFGEDGDDFIRGNAANDELDGGPGEDDIDGGTSKDTIYGQGGADILKGRTGNDSIFGGADDDIIEGGGGNDSMDGGTENDNCDGQGGTGDTATNCETVSNVP